jgi:perosamine synthetase
MPERRSCRREGLPLTKLVPRDRWEYHLGESLPALWDVLWPDANGERLSLDGLGETIPVKSGRAGLVAAIRALDLERGARVGVPLFCCPVVFHAVTAAGCAVRFIDIDPETYCLSARDLGLKRSQIDAVIAVHMFGNLCDMEKIEAVAGGKPIIEDCAQALGSRLNGQPAGSFGDVAFFSFRSGKYISAGEGGALFALNKSILSKASEIVATWPSPSRADEFAHAAKVYAKSMLRSQPLYGLMGHRLWGIYNKRMNQAEDQSISLGRITRVDLNIIRKRLGSLDLRVAEQRAHAEHFARHLQLEPEMLCSEKPGTLYNRYLYPISFRSHEERDIAAERLLRKRIDTMRYLDDVANTAATSFGYSGDCPVAETLSKRVLTIPGYHGLGQGRIDRVVEAVNSVWADMKHAATD